MIVHDVEQGSDQWLALRAGIPTASQFDRILTPKTRKISSSSFSYVCELIAETFVGPLDQYSSAFIQRGSEMEAKAVAYYEYHREVDTRTVGFITNDDRTVGCSPDRLVGDDGGLEIKIPGAGVHVQYLLEIPAKFMAQIQGYIWLTDRKWWDFLSWHPIIPSALVRIERDDEFIAALTSAMSDFLARLAEERATVQAMAGQGMFSVEAA